MLRRVALSLIISSAPFMAFANEPETPTSLKGGKIISIDEAGALSKSKGAICRYPQHSELRQGPYTWRGVGFVQGKERQG